MNSTKYDLYPLNSSPYSFILQQDKKIEEIESLPSTEIHVTTSIGFGLRENSQFSFSFQLDLYCL